MVLLTKLYLYFLKKIKLHLYFSFLIKFYMNFFFIFQNIVMITTIISRASFIFLKYHSYVLIKESFVIMKKIILMCFPSLLFNFLVL